MKRNEMKRLMPKPEQINKLINVTAHDPHSILGAHPITIDGEEKTVVRAYHPDAIMAEIIIDDESREMANIHKGGLFAALYEKELSGRLYKVRFTFESGNTWERIDPYKFMPTLGELDLYLAGEGKHEKLYEKLGAQFTEIDGVKGVSFAVWAPNANRVSLVGDFNNWDGRIYPMRSMGDSGIWEIFVPDVQQGAHYKFEIGTKSGDLRIKTAPYAFYMEQRPKTASIVYDINNYKWDDSEWMKNRESDMRFKPMAIYEVHLGSWMRVPDEDQRWLTYRELAPKLIEHVKRFNFTHIELLPISEHALDESWGYQVTGYYAPTSRFGTPEDFMYFVDLCHQNGIGVILDWVPAHFPKDDFSLRHFDGEALYEHADPRQGEHKDWGTLIFNFGRNEVRNFLVANALFWLDKYHIDGLRVDAVASMLYLDYSKEEGEWLPNKYGGRENIEAIDFIRHFNEAVYSNYSAFTIAEESTDWDGVSHPTYLGGLGFGYKWDMGWMHDTLLYFSKEAVHRKYHHNDLTFSMLYAYHENFILPLSHDEVVHGKGSLLNKMPGDEWQKFANLRTLFAYMYTHPGKKLLFMGCEFATCNEWYSQTSLDWHLLDDPMRLSFEKFFEDLSKLYIDSEALWSKDTHHDGFRWVDCNDSDNGVVSYIRRGNHSQLLCIMNLTPVPRHDYRIGVPGAKGYAEKLNSDASIYGGSNVGNNGYVQAENMPFHGFDHSISVTLPPLSCVIFEPVDEY
ncbi:1,4-alpha-glucan branching protein GlgB [Thermodesulfobacteriota bacterium]